MEISRKAITLTGVSGENRQIRADNYLHLQIQEVEVPKGINQ